MLASPLGAPWHVARNRRQALRFRHLIAGYLFPSTLSRERAESAKTIADRRSWTADDPIGKTSPPSFQAAPGSPSEHTSGAEPGPRRPLPSSAAHKSAPPGPT